MQQMKALRFAGVWGDGKGVGGIRMTLTFVTSMDSKNGCDI